jgi:hypothetical protein
MQTGITGYKFSDAGQWESKYVIINYYQYKLSPEMEIVYSEVSVYC